MKNKNLLPLLAVAGGLYLANQSGNKTSTTQDKALAFTGDTFADEEALKDALIKVIKANNIELRTLLRGNDGAKGEKGDTGATGLAGSQIQNYGGSLLENGALELGTVENWSGGIIGENNGAYPSLEINQSVRNLTNPPLNPYALYKISFYYKSEGNFNVGLYSLDVAGNDLNKGNGGYIAFQSTITSSVNFSKAIQYIGGTGIGSSNLAANGRRISLAFVNVASTTKISNLILEEVTLGEPVPHNLPYLPLNQTVLNNTTGKVGIFNGTTVDYYM